MPIPDYQSIMLPLLKFANDGKEHSNREAISLLAKQFQLTDEERKELLPSGKQATFDNRMGWAKTYMEKAGLLEKPRRAYFKITQRGQDLLATKLEVINIALLEQFDEFVEFRSTKHNKNNQKIPTRSDSTETPEESLETAYQSLRDELSDDILKAIHQCAPDFFEKLVVDLLISMGYGGSRKEAGQATQSTNDDGIDGIIKEDRLGLDTIYLQAKRWKNTVHRPEIDKFIGSLTRHRARKGVFITTSYFSDGAYEAVRNLDMKVVLIDGAGLSELMIEHNVGVTPVNKYEIKRMDTDYFIEE
ncbi:MAG: restriction endonuclease [Gammaproteobacteria bacterium]|nr:restriction endonuclease [Gammaproteobacteria bacterium]